MRYFRAELGLGLKLSLAMSLNLVKFFVTLPPSLGEVWPNAGSSEAVRSESCGNFSDSVQLLRTRLLPNVTATLP